MATASISGLAQYPEGYTAPYSIPYDDCVFHYPATSLRINRTKADNFEKALEQMNISVSDDFVSQFNADMDKLKYYNVSICVSIINGSTGDDYVSIAFGIDARAYVAHLHNVDYHSLESYPLYYDVYVENDNDRYYWYYEGLQFQTDFSEGTAYATAQEITDNVYIIIPYNSYYRCANATDYGISSNEDTTFTPQFTTHVLPGVQFKYTATVEGHYSDDNYIYSYTITGDTDSELSGGVMFNDETRSKWTDDGFKSISTQIGDTIYYAGIPVTALNYTTPFDGGPYYDNSLFIITEELEVLEVTNGGFINVYTTFSDGSNSASEALGQLASQFWSTGWLSGNTDNHRMSTVISLNILPQIPNYSSIAKGVQAGDELLPVGMTTGAYIFPVTSQFKNVDLGSISIERHFNNFLDFAPYTKMQVYLPFVGVMDVDVNEFMGGTISLEYAIDFISGNFQAMIHSNLHPQRPLYIFNGNCAVPIAITGSREDALIRGRIQTATALIGGASSLAMGTASGNAGMAMNGAISTVAAAANLGNLPSAGQTLRSGALTGNAGYMGAYGEYQPYVIISRPTRDETPSYYSHIRGFRSMKKARLGSLSGFTTMIGARVNNLNATQAERDEIMQLLQTGVIL